MAGHSQFKNIMYRKGAQDKKKAKIFTRLGREITVAVKEGKSTDVKANARLRLAIAQAKAQNMPKDNIEKAIAKALNNELNNAENITYEGYGPQGIAIIIEAITDNRNRTAPEIRSVFTKFKGTMGENVSFLFDYWALIEFENVKLTEDELMEILLDFKIVNYKIEEGLLQVLSDPKHMHNIVETLSDILKLEPLNVQRKYFAKEIQPINEEQKTTLIKMYEMLENIDDVNEVYMNVDLD